MARTRTSRHVRWSGGAGAFVVLALGLALGFGAPAGAQTVLPPVVPPDAGGLLPGLDPRLVGVAVEYSTSPRDVTALRDAQTRMAALVKERALLTARRDMLDGHIAFLDTAQKKAAQDLMEAIANVNRLTLLVYTKGDTGWKTSAIFQAETAL